jgi:hypothetical protein
METNDKGILDIGFPKLPKDVNLPKDIDRDDMRVQEQERFKQDTEQRKTLVVWMIIVVSLWLFFTCAVIFIEIYICKKLSDTTLCMLLGTTTANVLGLAMIVLRGLFPQSKK